MLGYLKLVPPWVWVSLGAAVLTTGVGVGAAIYNRAVISTVASIKEQIFERTQWEAMVNLKMDQETLRNDATFRDRIKSNDEFWKE